MRQQLPQSRLFENSTMDVVEPFGVFSSMVRLIVHVFRFLQLSVTKDITVFEVLGAK